MTATGKGCTFAAALCVVAILQVSPPMTGRGMKMENQHQKIIGYRELNQAEIDLMNEIKEKGGEFAELIQRLHDTQDQITAEYGTPDGEARRWISIGKTHLQQGLMALTRAVAKPEFF